MSCRRLAISLRFALREFRWFISGEEFLRLRLVDVRCGREEEEEVEHEGVKEDEPDDVELELL